MDGESIRVSAEVYSALFSLRYLCVQGVSEDSPAAVHLVHVVLLYHTATATGTLACLTQRQCEYL